jgi:hypothetical protein
MVDEDGNALRYTAWQRNFENKLITRRALQGEGQVQCDRTQEAPGKVMTLQSTRNI